MPKKYPKDKPPKHATVRIPKEMVEAIEEFLKTEPAKKRGFLHITDVVTEATRHLLKDLGYYPVEPRFEHFNVYEDHATIWDNLEKKLVDVYFRGDYPYCEFCGDFGCDHITFALSVPEIRKSLEEHGWVIKEDGTAYRRP